MEHVKYKRDEEYFKLYPHDLSQIDHEDQGDEK